MKTVIIDYAKISPAVLATMVERAFGCLCSWTDIDEDFFEFRVFYCTELDELEDLLAEYL